MRKRSKYRPKGVRLDTLDYVMTSIKPLATLKSEVATLRIKNHGALAAICQGRAGRTDVDMLIAAMNIAEALVIQGVGTDYATEIRAGQDALHDMAKRGVDLGNRFILRATELRDINTALEIHDAQLDAITMQQLERAVEYVTRVIKAGKARIIA
jgi:hypothetical protein